MRKIITLILFVSVGKFFAQLPDCVNLVNLVANPHFDSGNNGFSSTLDYGANCYPGNYFVDTCMRSKCSIWPVNFVDHTSANGNFLIIDGNDTYAPQEIWSENIQVVANTTYTFSFWAKNLYTQQPFNLGFMIGGSQVAMTPYIAAGSWNQYSTTWTASCSGIVPVSIRQITADPYRDLGIDDIFMGYCDRGTGIEPQKIQDATLKIFPNPANHKITINYSSTGSEKTMLLIKNVFGEIVHSESINTSVGNYSNTLDLGEQAKGLYLVEIICGNERSTKKIILE